MVPARIKPKQTIAKDDQSGGTDNEECSGLSGCLGSFAKGDRAEAGAWRHSGEAVLEQLPP